MARTAQSQPRATLADSLPGFPGLRLSKTALAWYRPLDARRKLVPGAAAPDLLRVPAAVATRALRAAAHLVADVPAGSPPTVVWVQGASELLVRLDALTLECTTGLVTLGIPVDCDQLGKPTPILVPLAVGSANRPAGLVMSTFDRLAGPDVITRIWSAALTAFAWEALVHLASQLSAAVGKDAAGRPLVPASIAAEADLLLVQPMARHQLGAIPSPATGQVAGTPR